MQNQGFRLWPKDMGIWIVIPSECFWFPSSVVSTGKNRGGTFNFDLFSVPVCCMAQLSVSSALVKTHGEADEGANSLS